jgi:serine/threonine protein kinase
LLGDSETRTTRREQALARERLGSRYELRTLLARGGMGMVHLAWDHRFGGEVVVKLPGPSWSDQGSERDLFLNEIECLSALDHPAILSILDAGVHALDMEELPYAVFPYLKGGSLRDRLHGGERRMSALEILEWLPSIADALDTTHRTGILHRDVKPSNILFDAEGHPVLSDFGIAAPLRRDRPARDEPTEFGRFLGSAAYAPPEAIDHILTPAYDQYGLATVTYQALAGDLPFPGQESDAILIAKESGTIPWIDREGESETISKRAQKPIRKALARRPGDRFDTCVAFAMAFEAAQAESRWTRIRRRFLAR